MDRHTRNVFTACATGSLLLFSGAQAQDSDLMLEEVLVTAQKRVQTLEDVPMAVSAIDGATVNDYLGGSQDIRALAARVPGLNIETSNGRTQPRFYLRGQGNIDFDVNANQPVAYVFDDIYFENNTLRSLPLFDIERVEVLKGPQGSLFGRNTNAGAIVITSVKPGEERNGYARLSYGSRNTVNAEAASNFGMSETFTMRASVKYQERDEWIDNTFTGPGDDFGGFEETAWRLQFRWAPTESFEGNLKLHGFDQEGSDPNVFYANAIQQGFKGLRPGFDEEIASQDNLVADMDTEHWGLALNLKFFLANDMELTSITGYDTVENFQSADVDGGVVSFDPADAGELGKQLFFNVATGDGLNDHDQWTQEFRLSGDTDQIFWQAGLYYFDEDFEVFNRSFTNPPESALVTQQTTSYAVFGQLEYEFIENARVTFGARWTDDDKDLQVRPAFEQTTIIPSEISVSDNFVNWDLAVSWDASDIWTLYGRIATGARGPVTLGRFGFVSSADTEEGLSGELGFKSLHLDGRLRWNGAVYSFRNDDHQLTATGGVANVNQLLNADQVDGYGMETEVDWLVNDNLRLTANLSYNKTEIDDPGLRDDLCGSTPSCTGLDPVAGVRDGPFGPVTEVFIDGNPLPRTPEWIFNFILDYRYPIASGDLYFNTDWNYRDDSNLFLHRSIEFVQEERWLGGIRTGYRTDSWDFALVGRNVTDEIVVDGAINFLNLTAFVNEPRYWGLEAVYNF
jgi:iron complex outermembrane receptor protein